MEKKGRRAALFLLVAIAVGGGAVFSRQCSPSAVAPGSFEPGDPVEQGSSGESSPLAMGSDKAGAARGSIQVETPVRNARCLREAFPTLGSGKSAFTFSDLEGQDGGATLVSVSRTVEAGGKALLIVADQAPKAVGEGTREPEAPFMVRVFDIAVPERPIELESAPVSSVEEVYSWHPEARTWIEERTYRGVGPSRATVVLRNGQLERIGFASGSDLRCEVDADRAQANADSDAVVELVCECGE